jgi:dCMP deaminase
MLHSFSWDQYFMTMAYLVSMKSKDPSTRIGAVIVGPDREIRGTGYNGLPRGVADHKYRYEDREYKLLAVNHAEENAILNCALNGVSAKGCIMYSPWLSCSRCAKSIIQAGIVELVYDVNFPGNQQAVDHDWKKSMDIAKELLLEAGVAIREYSGLLIEIQGLFKGVDYKLKSTSQP